MLTGRRRFVKQDPGLIFSLSHMRQHVFLYSTEHEPCTTHHPSFLPFFLFTVDRFLTGQSSEPLPQQQQPAAVRMRNEANMLGIFLRLSSNGWIWIPSSTNTHLSIVLNMVPPTSRISHIYSPLASGVNRPIVDQNGQCF